VKNAITTTSIILEILHVYKDKTVDEMLRDIHFKVTGQSGELFTAKKIKEPKEKPLFEVKEALALLKTLSRDQVLEYIKRQEKTNIEQILTLNNLSFSAKDNKHDLAEKLANFYNIINLNEQMSERYIDRSTSESER